MQKVNPNTCFIGVVEGDQETDLWQGRGGGEREKESQLHWIAERKGEMRVLSPRTGGSLNGGKEPCINCPPHDNR